MTIPDTQAASPCALTRRRLLVSAAALGATATIGGMPGRARAAGPQEILSGSHWGAFHARVEDGRFVSLRPWEKDPRPSPTLAGVQDIVYNPARIRYPMVRRAWLEQGPGAAPETRGTGDFVRVSWDKALDLVAGEIRRMQAEHGPWALFGGSYGWRSSGRVGNPQTMLKRLLNLSGGYVESSSNYSKAALEGIMPYVVGSVEAEGQQTAYGTVTENTELLVFWACSPLGNNHISAAIPDHQVWGWFDELAKRGKKAIFIDPVRTDACKKLNAEWIAPRPHTDVAMMIGIAHTLLSENLHDSKFLKDCTRGFDRFADYLTGKSDGIAKSVEWAEAICGIPAAVIRDLARRFAKNRTMLVGGWATQRQQHGEQAPWMLITLACMLGQIGLPGGGFVQRYHIDGGGAPMSLAPPLGNGMSAGKRVETKPWTEDRGTKVIPCARIVDMLLNPGGEYEHNGKRFKYPDVRFAYWVGGNPFHHHQDRNRQVAAWKKFETFIVQDFQWTASARMADIVLPATTTVERNDIERVGPSAGVAIMAMRKIIDPVFEARNDYDIFKDLAKRLGVEQPFTEGKSEMDWIRASYDAALAAAKPKNIPMPDFDSFWNGAGVVEFEVPAASKKWIKYAAFRQDPLLNPLPTPSGKIEIFSTAIERMKYEDCPPHPTWMEPVERLGRPGKYPLHVNSSHPELRLHSQLCGSAAVRKLYEVAGRSPCWINPADAASRGIKDGDTVRVFNDRGQCLAGAVVTEDIRPGVLRLQEGAWYDPLDPGKPDTLCKFGDPNVLTPDIGTSRLSQATSACTTMAEVEKFQGMPPEVTVFTAPARAG
ncbi:trimethylamine N-oxide reductase 1 [Rhodovastum atsumiense]|uniref:trimethylamine-N-oxide reductase n=1 Tax=Rhodovastum atsumiense TaxID=504468 RepID=A0A5M6IW40_9PROT|nr:trimethylamine-N-oxide reductase TorA [Rhodovastum atsumiense]KAA5612553.1 trimethylamine-N-oxide reductase TorA [Rhodovastum atsumiense]CAH2601362.1 trimethylamine N-oxide reductase 1 [Rhodovastum atsumiense]